MAEAEQTQSDKSQEVKDKLVYKITKTTPQATESRPNVLPNLPEKKDQYNLMPDGSLSRADDGAVIDALNREDVENRAMIQNINSRMPQ